MWYVDVLASVPNDVRFSSAKVGDYRVSLARDTVTGAFGLAVCSPSDGFNRKQGQAMAYARLLTQGGAAFSGLLTHLPGGGGGENAIFAANVVADQFPDHMPTAFLSALAVETDRLKERTQK